MQKINALKIKDVPKHLRGDYTGRKFQLEAKTEVVIPAESNVWDSGTRDTYKAIRLEDGAVIQLGSTESPYSDRTDTTVKLVPGIAVVRHSVFCGKDYGLTYYLHPDNMLKFIK